MGKSALISDRGMLIPDDIGTKQIPLSQSVFCQQNKYLMLFDL